MQANHIYSISSSKATHTDSATSGTSCKTLPTFLCLLYTPPNKWPHSLGLQPSPRRFSTLHIRGANIYCCNLIGLLQNAAPHLGASHYLTLKSRPPFWNLQVSDIFKRLSTNSQQSSMNDSFTHTTSRNMDPLTSSPTRSPALPPRGAPLGGKTCPALHQPHSPKCGRGPAHVPHQPLPPMPSLVLAHPSNITTQEDHVVAVQQEQQEEHQLPKENEYEHSSVHGYTFSAGNTVVAKQE